MCFTDVYSPCEHHHKVHDVPAVPQVGVLVECETECQDFYSRLKTEDADEVRLCIILREDRTTKDRKHVRNRY